MVLTPYAFGSNAFPSTNSRKQLAAELSGLSLFRHDVERPRGRDRRLVGTVRRRERVADVADRHHARLDQNRLASHVAWRWLEASTSIRIEGTTLSRGRIRQASVGGAR